MAKLRLKTRQKVENINADTGKAEEVIREDGRIKERVRGTEGETSQSNQGN